MICYNCAVTRANYNSDWRHPMLKIVFILLGYALISVLLGILELFGI